MKRLIWLAMLPFWLLVGCGSATETPPPTATQAVVIIQVVATPAWTETPLATPSPSATATLIPGPPAASSTPTRTLARPTATKPRPTATPPDTLSDGNYTSSGSVRVQFTVSGGGTLASGGFFSFHCPVDQALSTYGFSEPAPVTQGKFEFKALPAPSGAAQVSMSCTATTLTQARCVIRNLLATNKCLDTPANASRK